MADTAHAAAGADQGVGPSPHQRLPRRLPPLRPSPLQTRASAQVHSSGCHGGRHRSRRRSHPVSPPSPTHFGLGFSLCTAVGRCLDIVDQWPTTPQAHTSHAAPRLVCGETTHREGCLLIVYGHVVLAAGSVCCPFFAPSHRTQFHHLSGQSAVSCMLVYIFLAQQDC